MPASAAAQRTLRAVAGHSLALAVELAIGQAQVDEPALPENATAVSQGRQSECSRWVPSKAAHGKSVMVACARSGSRRCQHLPPQCGPAMQSSSQQVFW